MSENGNGEGWLARLHTEPRDDVIAEAVELDRLLADLREIHDLEGAIAVARDALVDDLRLRRDAALTAAYSEIP